MWLVNFLIVRTIVMEEVYVKTRFVFVLLSLPETHAKTRNAREIVLPREPVITEFAHVVKDLLEKLAILKLV